MTTANTSPAASGAAQTDPLALIDVDHVRFYVGNAKQAAYFYAHTFGFKIEQLRRTSPPARRDEAASYLLTQGNIRHACSPPPLTKDHPAASTRSSCSMETASRTWRSPSTTRTEGLRAGATQRRRVGHTSRSHRSATIDGTVVTFASIKTYGRVIHTFVSRHRRRTPLPKVKQGADLHAPVFKKMDSLGVNAMNNEANPCGLKYVDHLRRQCRGGQDELLGRSGTRTCMGFKMFKHFDDADISTEYSALMSKVMASGNNLIKMPINEPAEGKKKSQIQEYLEWHDMTPGVQHLALRTDDELHSVAELRRRGVDFLALPDTYYEAGLGPRQQDVLKRTATTSVKEDHERIKDLGILVDADDEGYLLQLFTKPLQDRPTLFFEIICRRGSQSFGKGNFKALFEALELEQERRGNL